VTSNSDNLRMRLYWVDVRKDKIELFGGQSWSMLTPNRKGLSALPSDLLYAGYRCELSGGLVWSRNPQFRLSCILQPKSPWACRSKARNSTSAARAEAAGDAAFGPVDALCDPVEQRNTALSVPDVHPDVIAKVAFDQAVGRIRSCRFVPPFKVYNPLNQNHFSAHGGGAR